MISSTNNKLTTNNTNSNIERTNNTNSTLTNKQPNNDAHYTYKQHKQNDEQYMDQDIDIISNNSNTNCINSNRVSIVTIVLLLLLLQTTKERRTIQTVTLIRTLLYYLLIFATTTTTTITYCTITPYLLIQYLTTECDKTNSKLDQDIEYHRYKAAIH